MITSCKYDPLRDIQQVVPDLEISIEMAMTTGVIKNTATSIPYSKETDVENVGNYLHDSIEIAMAAKRLGESMSNLQPTDVKPSGE